MSQNKTVSLKSFWQLEKEISNPVSSLRVSVSASANEGGISSYLGHFSSFFCQCDSDNNVGRLDVA